MLILSLLSRLFLLLFIFFFVERPLFYSMCARCQMKVWRKRKLRFKRKSFICCLSFRVESFVFVTRFVSSIIQFFFHWITKKKHTYIHKQSKHKIIHCRCCQFDWKIFQRYSNTLFWWEWLVRYSIRLMIVMKFSISMNL